MPVDFAKNNVVVAFYVLAITCLLTLSSASGYLLDRILVNMGGHRTPPVFVLYCRLYLIRLYLRSVVHVFFSVYLHHVL